MKTENEVWLITATCAGLRDAKCYVLAESVDDAIRKAKKFLKREYRTYRIVKAERLHVIDAR